MFEYTFEIMFEYTFEITLLITLIIGLIGVIAFNSIQKEYQNSKNISEITKNLIPLDLCIKKRQCLDQIKNNNHILTIINIKAKFLNQNKIGIYLLNNNSKKNMIEINMTNPKSNITKIFEIIDTDTTQIEECFLSMIQLKEYGVPLGNLSDTININCIVNLNNYEIQKIINIKFIYAKFKSMQEFEIDSLVHINDLITLNVSTNSNYQF